MNKTKKIKLYELDPRFFKDSTSNGIGDFKGLIGKLDYFKYLEVDALILKNVLSSVSEDTVQNFTSIAKDLGTLEDLKEIIETTKGFGTKIFLEIGIGLIKETHKWFTNATIKKQKDFAGIVDFKETKSEGPTGENLTLEMKFNETVNRYYPFDGTNKGVPLDWRNENVMDQFIKVIRFWMSIGIEGFVFKDFEFLADSERTEIMSVATLQELRKFFRTIKEINDDIVIVGKSLDVPIDSTNDFTEGSTKVFDYFMSEKISLIGTSSKFGNDQVGKFKPSSLADSMKKFIKNASNILTFGSSLTGRINSRWGDHGQYSVESAKALGMLLSLTPASSSIYYGDEIGSLNIGLTYLDNFQDDNLEVRKKDLATKKLKEEDFMNAQVSQNPINSKSLMSWNSDKNGGFSDAEKTITPVSNTYKEINVMNQYTDKNSTLNFYKRLMRIISKSSYATTIAAGEFSVSSSILGVVKTVSKLKDKEVRTFINLSDKTKKILKPKEGRVILSSYRNKRYSDIPSALEPFEAIVVSKHTDEFIQLTQQFRIKEQSENGYKKGPRQVDISYDKNEITYAKEAAKAERQSSRMLKKDTDKFSIMEEEILESERTSLTEADIAPTTQINADSIDDFETFLKNNKL